MCINLVARAAPVVCMNIYRGGERERLDLVVKDQVGDARVSRGRLAYCSFRRSEGEGRDGEVGMVYGAA